MHLTFKETKEEVYAVQRVSKHVSPHLHNALEIVCVTEGTLEMGVSAKVSVKSGLCALRADFCCH